MESTEQVILAHGSGGSMMRELIDQYFLAVYGSPELQTGDDSACLPLPAGADQLAFTTDSFVVTPRFFPGGDIGRLAVCGTVNDLATSGATPHWLSLSFILEEGLPLDELAAICRSIAETAREADVRIVTGDTKVVPRGSGDGIYINTAGIAVFGPGQMRRSGRGCQPGDQILLSGALGDHGLAIASSRAELHFQTVLTSDVAPLNQLVAALLAAAPNTRALRDPTRGGLAATINELAEQSQTTMLIEESTVPVHDAVRGAAEMLGYDIFQVANEGKMVAIVPAAEVTAALAALRGHPLGREAAIIGTVHPAGQPGQPRAVVRTALGARRILDTLVGEQLPRIC